MIFPGGSEGGKHASGEKVMFSIINEVSQSLEPHLLNRRGDVPQDAGKTSRTL
jgi:hypothetical protein